MWRKSWTKLIFTLVGIKKGYIVSNPLWMFPISTLFCRFVDVRFSSSSDEIFSCFSSIAQIDQTLNLYQPELLHLLAASVRLPATRKGNMQKVAYVPGYVCMYISCWGKSNLSFARAYTENAHCEVYLHLLSYRIETVLFVHPGWLGSRSF